MLKSMAIFWFSAKAALGCLKSDSKMLHARKSDRFSVRINFQKKIYSEKNFSFFKIFSYGFEDVVLPKARYCMLY